MLHRCKETYTDIFKVASVGGGEIANLKAGHFSYFQFQLCHQRSLLNFLYLWTIGQKSYVQIFFSLLINHPEYPEGHLKENVWIFSLIKLLIHNLSKMVHRCKKCDDISEVTSGGRIGNVKNL